MVEEKKGHSAEIHPAAKHPEKKEHPPKKHPNEENPLGDSHDTHSSGEKMAIRILSVGLVAGLIMVPVISATAYSPMGNVFLGLLPFLLTLVCCLVAVGNHYKRHVLWIILVLVHLVGLALLYFVNEMLVTKINVGQAVSVSVLLSAIVVVLAYMADASKEQRRTHTRRRPLPEMFTPEQLPEFVQSIEDKAKALNFAIGRVYRNSNGGSAKLRERLRIPREWYNDFRSAEEADRVKKAKIIVKKIHDRLLLYNEEEKDVFSDDERKKFKNVARKKNGTSTVLTVLRENDSDPVEHYYQQAVEFCEKVLHGLG